MRVVGQDGPPVSCVLLANHPRVRPRAFQAGPHLGEVDRSQSDILIGPVLPQHFLLMLIRVLIVLALLLEFLVSEYRHVPEEVVAAVCHNLPGEVEANTLKKPLPSDFVEPVELKHERYEINGGKAVLNCPVLPLQPEYVKLERQHLCTPGVRIDALSVGGN